MILSPAPVSTAQLHYESESRLYVGDISDTNGFGRVYDDACDLGLTLISKVTGKAVVFVITETFLDDEGDVAGWMLAPASSIAPRLSVQLFND